MAKKASKHSTKQTSRIKPGRTVDTKSTKYGNTRLKRKAAKSLQNDSNHTLATQSVIVEEHFESMFTALHELQQEGKYCDIILKSKEGSIKAHSAVLMAATPQLCEKFKAIEPAVDGEMKCVHLTHAPHWAVEDLISFIYSGKVQLLKVRLAEFGKLCKSLGLTKLSEKLQDKSGKKSFSGDCIKDSDEKVNSVINSTNQKKFVSENRTLLQKTRKRACDKSNPKLIKGKSESLTVNKGLDVTDSLKRNFETEENLKKDPYETIEASEHLREFDNDISDVQCLDSSFIDVKGSNTLKDNATKSMSKNAEDLDSDESLVQNEKHSMKNKADIDTNACDMLNELVKGNIKPEEPHGDMHTSSQNENEPEGLTVNESADVSNTADSDDVSENYTDETDSEYNPPRKKPKDDTDVKNLTTSKCTSINEDCDKNQLTGTYCKRCKENFDSYRELKKHRKTCKGNRPRKRCILCKISFASAEEYLHHRKTDEKCLEIQRQKHQKRLHRKAQLRAKFSCRVCPRKFRRVADHIDHEFVAHDLPYDKEQWPDLFCEYCKYWTMNPWRLHHHKTYDCSKGQEYICDMCGNKYKNEKTLKCHKELQHTDALPMIPCDQCGKTLKGPKGLQHHIRIMHKGENPHKRHMCHICSMKYTSSNDLSFHLHKVHSQPLPDGFVVYKCEECDYIINNKRTFDKHRMLHEDKRDFHCEVCSKAFKTKNSLHTHMKSHTGKKMPCPYDGCNYGALKKCHLKTHIENQHTQKGVKNEECHLCQYSTFFKGNLIKHLRSVHQLEVVTRYSVQMKAKYKNLKTGDIVGKVDHPEPQKVKKKQEPKSAETASKPKTKKTNKTDSRPEQTEDIQYSAVVTTSVEHSKDISEDSSVRKYYPMVDYNRQITGPVLQHVGANMAIPNDNHQYLFTMNNVAMPGNSNNINSLSNVYGSTPDMPVDSGASMQITLPSVSGSLRETIPPMYGNKMSAGVAPPIVFHPSVADDEVTNAAKMLTYFQM